MNLRLAVVAWYVPPRVKRRMLEDLFRVTAEAFGRASAPTSRGLSFEEGLRAYAAFTRAEATRAIEDGRDVEAIRDRLREGARRMGEALRERLRVSSRDEVMRALAIAYRQIGIDLAGDQGGEVIVRRCYFSAFYRPEVCGLISALDEGIAAGLSAGGVLVFQGHITDGAESCRAHLDIPETEP